MPDEVSIPSAFSFAWDTVQVLRDLGGSGSIEEINEAVVKLRRLTEAQQSIPHPTGSRTEIEYRLAWARTLVKELGLITNSERGVWVLTEAGWEVDEKTVEELKRKRARDRAAARNNAKQKAAADVDSEEVVDVDVDPEGTSSGDSDWKADLLHVLKGWTHPPSSAWRSVRSEKRGSQTLR